MISKNGVLVVDRPWSHIHCPLYWLEKAISKSTIQDLQYQRIECEFDREYGKTQCVQTTDADNIVYLQRGRRAGLTRYVVGREPEPTRYLTFFLLRGDQGEFVLITAFWGKGSEPEPWDEKAFAKDPRGYENAKQASIEFWAHHALVISNE